MEIGTVLPQLEIGNDPETIADYAHRVETSGYEHVLAYDHVLGVNPDREAGTARTTTRARSTNR